MASAHELIRTHCSAGWLVVTETAIRIERKGLLGAGSHLQVLPRAQLSGGHLDVGVKTSERTVQRHRLAWERDHSQRAVK